MLFAFKFEKTFWGIKAINLNDALFNVSFFLLKVESCSLTLKTFLNKYDTSLNWKCNSDKML